MKKLLFFGLLFVIGLTTFTSCNETGSKYEEKAIIRHEEQEYDNVKDLVNEVAGIVTNNDVVFVEELNRPFRWIQGSALVHDGVYVIEQTAEAANGRWVALSVASIHEAVPLATSTSILANAQSEEIHIYTPGVDIGKANFVAILNGDDLPEHVFIFQKEVFTKDSTSIVVVNESGTIIQSFDIEIKVLEF